jgi:hypothetical protein
MNTRRMAAMNPLAVLLPWPWRRGFLPHSVVLRPHGEAHYVCGRSTQPNDMAKKKFSYAPSPAAFNCGHPFWKTGKTLGAAHIGVRI